MSERLSVVVAIKERWPAARRCLDALYPQVTEAHGELIAPVEPGASPADRETRYPGVVWIDCKGKSIFELRALAVDRARGAIVALTEDHARVTPGWCRTMLAAHAEHPEAAAIGGVVENGATETAIDWASFFVSNSFYMAPVRPGPSEAISLQANVSYKRRALSMDSFGGGLMQMTFHDELRRRGETLLADPNLVVFHEQRMSFAEHSRAHFHNGRSIATFRLPTMSAAERVLRALGCAALPPVMLMRTTRVVLAKRRHLERFVEALPLTVWLLLCHAAGELAGYVAGPGGSPWKVH